MRTLFMKRGKGKTTAMVYTSALTGYPILTYTKAQCDNLVEKATALGVNIPKPINIGEDLRGRSFSVDHVLIDEAEPILQYLVKKFTGLDVVASTMTIGENSDATYSG